MNQVLVKIKNFISEYKFFIFIVIFALLFLHIYYLKALIFIDSDNSTMLLETADFLKGNFFFKGWDNEWFSSGITYITTDMLFFMLGIKLFNISATSIIFAWTLIIFLCIAIAFLLIKDEKKEITVSNLIIFLCLLGLSYFFIFFLHFHSGCFIYQYLICLLIAKYLTNSDKLYLFFIAALCGLAVFGDMIAITIIAFPVLIYSLLKIFHKSDIKKNIYLILSVSLSTFAGYILLQLFSSHFSGIPHTHQELIHFTYGTCIQRIIHVFNQISMLCGVDCYDNKIFDFVVWVPFSRYIIIIIGFYLVYLNIKKCLLNDNPDFISSYLSFSIFIQLMILLLTTYNVDVFSARYLSFLAINFAVIIMRYYNCFENLNSHQFKFILCSLLILLCCSTISSYKKENPVSSEIKTIHNILKQNNLRNGINTNYWTSSSVTVFSKNNIKVRAVQINEVNAIEPLDFYAKEEWYNEPVEFVILFDGDNIYNNVLDKKLTEKSKQIVEINKYKIYILNKKYSNYIDLQT